MLGWLRRLRAWMRQHVPLSVASFDPPLCCANMMGRCTCVAHMRPSDLRWIFVCKWLDAILELAQWLSIGLTGFATGQSLPRSLG